MCGRRDGRTVALMSPLSRSLAAAMVAAAVVAAPAPAAAQYRALPAERVQVSSFDGTRLDGVVIRPDVPAGVRVPVVVQIGTYHGNLDASFEDSQEGPAAGRRVVPVQRLVAEGYAVAAFSVRGTGASGGCFDFFGAREQRDTKLLVEWLADQPWSRGRVGMIGRSYDGTVAFEAAVHRARGLATIVVAGISPELYQTMYSPQGAPYDDQYALVGAFYAGISAAPRRSTPERQPEFVLDQIGVARQRLCPEVERWLVETSAGWTLPARDARFYAERNLLARFGDVRAAVLLGHGFQDHIVFGEDLAWQALRRAPKYQLEGQWLHALPQVPDWNERLVEWFDYWLKRTGPKPDGLDSVDYQDSGGTWRRSTAWPPAEAREEALQLAGHRLAPVPGGAARRFRAAPDTAQAEMSFAPREGGPAPYAPPCGPAEVTTALSYSTEPLGETVVVAGNPRALVRISSDQPAGRFSLRLFTLAPNFECAGTRAAGDHRFLGEGTVDLRFHSGNFEARPFPVGRRLDVRVDIPSLAERIPAGHRVAAVIGYGPQKTSAWAGGAPELTVHGGELALPVVNGTLGGASPAADYPQRPFAP